jgi:hypothetical protein
VTTILRWCFEKETVASLRDILKAERKKRETRGESGDSSEITFLAFASKEEVVNELLTKHLRTCVIRIGTLYFIFRFLFCFVFFFG